MQRREPELQIRADQVRLRINRLERREAMMSVSEFYSNFKENEQSFRQLANSMPQMVWITDAQGNVEFVNQRWFEYSGHDIAHFTKQNWIEATHPDDRARVIKAHLDTVATNSDFMCEYRVRRRDGQYRWFLARTTVIPMADGSFKRFGTATDINEQINAQELVKNFYGFLDEISRILASSLNYTEILKKLVEMSVPRLGDYCSIGTIKIQSLESESWSVFEHHGDPEMLALAKEFREKYPTDWNAENGEAKVLKKRESIFVPVVTPEMLQAGSHDAERRALIQKLKIYSLIMVPLVGHKQANGVLTLISSHPDKPYNEVDLKLAEELGRRAGQAIENAKLYEEAQNAIRSRDSLISISAHELLTPITASKLQMQLLKRKIVQGLSIPNEILSKTADQIERQLNRVTRLVNEMLDLSRINIGKLVPTKEDTDLSILMSDIVERLEPQMQVANCKVTVDIENELHALVDPARIEQVVSNLLLNAARYSKGKPVRVKLFRENNFAVISVRDEGIGIKIEDQDRIFLKFERAVSIDEGSGLGIGLFLVKQIVDAHGGQVFVKSEITKGSTFTVKLPIWEQ